MQTPPIVSRRPPKLKAGDEIRVLALSRSLGGAMQQAGFSKEDVIFATHQLEAMGLKVSFGRHVHECNEHLTASPAHRLEDMHETFATPGVKAIIAVTGGISAIQLLDGIDYKLIAANPKIVCGYSDVGYVLNAIYARTGMTTYYGPNFTSFMMRDGADYTLVRFRECLFEESDLRLQPSEKWSDDAWHKNQTERIFHANNGWWCVQEGEAEGIVIGGSCWCLNLLQGTKFFPPLDESILFLEHPAEGKATLMSLDSSLRSLSFQPSFSNVRAIVLGRYAENGGVTRTNLAQLIRQIPGMRNLPVLANCDFGHTTPMATVPIGGRCKLYAGSNKCQLTFTEP